MWLELAGWSGRTDRLARDPISGALLKKKGVGVAVSAVAGPIGTAFGVYKVTGSVTAAAVSASAVLALVLTVDRDYIFASDVQSKVKKTGLFRVPLVLMAAIPTTYAAFLELNRPHLEAVAADIRTERAVQRQTTYDSATGLVAARVAETGAEAKLDKLRASRLSLPPDIEGRKAAAATCAMHADQRLDALLRNGIRPRDVRAAVAASRQRCAKDARDADAAERDYFTGIDADIARARNAASTSANAVAEAAKTKHGLLAQANALDATAVEPTSLPVAKRYLRDNWLAWFELVAAYVIFVVCDSAGLLMASLLGRSPAGLRFERDRLLKSASLAVEVANAHQQIVQSEGLMRQATKAARSNDAVAHIREEMAAVQRQIATENAKVQLRAASLLAAAASIRAMVAASLEAEEEARRAHEIRPALGRVADAIITRAANDSLREVAA